MLRVVLPSSASKNVGFWILPSAQLGSRNETGDETEDPNDSLTMRTPFTALRPEQIPESLVSPSEF